MTKSEFKCKDMGDDRGLNKCIECPFYTVFDGCCWAKNDDETLEEIYQRFSKMLQKVREQLDEELDDILPSKRNEVETYWD